MEDKEQVTTEEHDVTPKMGELEESLIRNAKQITSNCNYQKERRM